MKQLTWKLILPMTIISFFTITKWWYVDIVGEFDEILIGFPLPYVCKGWHTSLSLQIFISELLINLLAYFVFWSILIFIINRFVKKIRLHKTMTVILLSVSGFLLTAMVIAASNPDNMYTLKRDFDIEIMETGYKFIWGNQTHPDYDKYHPEMKKE